MAILRSSAAGKLAIHGDAYSALCVDCGIHRLLDLSQTWARNIAPLRSGMHTVIVQITAGDELIVGLDGEQAMQ